MSGESWREVKLGELATMKYGKMPKKAEMVDDGYPVFSGYRVVGYYPTYMYEEPMLVVVARGVGGTGDVKLSPPQSFITNLSIVLDVDSNQVDKHFLYYYLSNQNLKMLDSGSAQSQITINDLKHYKVRLPRLETQRRIVQILGSVDRKIALNEKINHTLEEMAQALYRSWLVDFEPFRDGAFDDSEMGPIPAGWRVVKLKEVIDVLDAKRVPLSKIERSKRKGRFPYYGATGVIDYVDDYLFDGVHVLVGEDGSVINENDNPYVQYVWGTFWVNNHAHVLKGKQGVTEELLYTFLKQVNIAPYITGAVQLKLNQANLNRIPFVLPTGSILDELGARLTSIFALVRKNKEENDTLTNLRQVLLPKLMSGEVVVRA
jgi:type I restriction enzyme, S subunit